MLLLNMMDLSKNFVWLSELDKKKKNSATDAYVNDKSCAEFVKYIALTEMEKYPTKYQR